MSPRWCLVAALVLVTTGCLAAQDADPGSEVEPLPEPPNASKAPGNLTSGPSGNDSSGSQEGQGEERPWNAVGTERVDAPLMWRGLDRLGYAAGATAPESIALDWQRSGFNKGDHTAAKGSALVVNGTVLAGADTGTLYRMSLDGEVLWAAATHPSGFGIHGTPAVAGSTVYIGAYDGALYAFDLATGQQLWRTVLGGSIGSSPAYHQGKVYVSVETPEPSGILSVVDAETGELLFEDTRITDHPHSSVALDPAGDVLVVGANDGMLYAWNITDLSFLWSFATGDAIKGPVTVHNGSAFFGSWDDAVYRVDLATGEEVWSHETGGNVMGGVAIHPGDDVLYVGSFDDHLYALDAATGELLWRTELGGSILSSPLVTEDAVLVGSYDEDLYALERDTGQVRWQYGAGGRVTSSPVLAGDRIIFLDRADEATGRLYVLGPAGR